MVTYVRSGRAADSARLLAGVAAVLVIAALSLVGCGDYENLLSPAETGLILPSGSAWVNSEYAGTGDSSYAEGIVFQGNGEYQEIKRDGYFYGDWYWYIQSTNTWDIIESGNNVIIGGVRYQYVVSDNDLQLTAKQTGRVKSYYRKNYVYAMWQ